MKIETILGKGQGFSLALGGELLKGKKPVVLAGWRGELFVLEVPDARKESLKAGERGVDLSPVFRTDNAKPAEPRVQLTDLAIDNALQLDGSKKINGSVQCKLLKEIEGTAVVRLICGAGGTTRTYASTLSPIAADTKSINFDFPP